MSTLRSFETYSKCGSTSHGSRSRRMPHGHDSVETGGAVGPDTTSGEPRRNTSIRANEQLLWVVDDAKESSDNSFTRDGSGLGVRSAQAVFRTFGTVAHAPSPHLHLLIRSKAALR
jgi:hypothetical protein